MKLTTFWIEPSCHVPFTGKKMLLVCTDAASSRDEMLGIELRRSPTAVPGAPGLGMLKIDPDSATESCRQRVQPQMCAAATERANARLCGNSCPMRAPRTSRRSTNSLPSYVVAHRQRGARRLCVAYRGHWTLDAAGGCDRCLSPTNDARGRMTRKRAHDHGVDACARRCMHQDHSDNPARG
jgi:hypothetical protein